MVRRGRAVPRQDPGGCGVLALIVFVLFVIGRCSGGDEDPAATNGFGSAASEPGGASSRYVSTDALNCRAAASVSSRALARLARGDGVVVRQEKDGWAEVDRGGTTCWVAARFLSESYPAPAVEPVPERAPEQTTVRSYDDDEERFQCGGKRTCGEMNSCAEANHYLDQCGVSRLDGDGDGVPCETICG